MRYNITGRNIKITQSLKDSISDKLSKLDKYFHEDTEVRVTLSVQKDDHKIEVTIPTKRHIIRAEEINKDMYTAIDLITDTIERQIKRYKTKLIDKKQSAPAFSDFFIREEGPDKEDEINIVKVKRFAVKPMDAEEACLQMEMLNHNFYVFPNSQTDQVNVVYKRNDSSYGQIEPEL